MIERPNLDKMETWATSFDRREMLVLIQYTRQLEAEMNSLRQKIMEDGLEYVERYLDGEYDE